VVAQLRQFKLNRTTVLWMLTLVYMFSLVDRQIVGILSPIIKADLGFTDSQLGWLKGFAFALLYTSVGIPLAWLADRFNRVRIIAISLVVWSAFTVFTGMATTFVGMLIARIGVGIGEAGGTPPAHSIISDLYAKEQRTSALAIYGLGVPLGITLAFVTSAVLVEWIGWRGTLVVLGIGGIIFAVIMLMLIDEPQRGQMDLQTDQADLPISIRASLSILSTIPSWWGMCLGMAFVSFGSYAVSAWGTDYVFRFDANYIAGTENSKFQSYMLVMAVVHFIGLGFGTYLGGLLAERYSRRNVAAYAWVPIAAILLGAPCLMLAFWVDSVPLHLMFIGIYITLSGVWVAPCFAAAQTLVPVRMRAMSTAMFFLILNIIGLGCGHTYVGLLSDMLMPAYGELQSLRLAITSLAVVYVIGIGFFLLAAKNLRYDWPIES
jgi:MFS family permease